MENKKMEEIVAAQPTEETFVQQQTEQQLVQGTVSTEEPEKETAEAAKDGVAKVANAAVKAVKKLGKKIWIIAAAIAVVLVAVIVLAGVMSNTYKTPLDLQLKQQNSRKVPKSLNGMISQLNGFSEKEMKNLIDILEKSDIYEELLEGVQDTFEEQVEDYENQYGENYKFSYVIDYKEELEKEDLRNFKAMIKRQAENMKESVEETEDWDSSDWEDIADEIGLTKAQLKKLIRALEDLCDTWSDVKVTKGYELTVLKTVDGSELDEPKEMTSTVYVFKVNGRWISSAAIYSVPTMR